VFCTNSHAYRETVEFKTSEPPSQARLTRTLTHPKTTPSQTRLIVEFLWNGLPKRRCILLI